MDTRLKLPGLFSSIDYEPQPISVGFVAEQVIFSPLTTQNINTLTSAMRNNGLLRLDYNFLTMEELAINHIRTDIYFKHSAAKYREDTELSLPPLFHLVVYFQHYGHYTESLGIKLL